MPLPFKDSIPLMRRVTLIALALMTIGIIATIGGVGWQAYQDSKLGYLDARSECAPTLASLGGPWGQTEILVEVADTDETRAQGLMFREHLEPGTGMLFVYPEATAPVFWMKNTPIPLDMLFFDARGDLRHVHFNAQPYDETPIPGGEGIKFVLEVEAGEVNRLGIGPRTTLRHPSIAPENARWAC